MSLLECLDEESLVAFIERRLQADESARIDHHVDRCAACRSLVTTLTELYLQPQSAAQAPTLGSTLGRYLIARRLGAGGMGVVYLAYDPQLDRKVALKVLSTRSASHASPAHARVRLLREAQAMARLSHRNVVAIYDVGVVGEQVFLAMELVEGLTLRAWLEARPRAHREVLEVFIQAGRGLAAAHRAGIIHRDFKPENVLVDEADRAHVTDFGLARAPADPADGLGSSVGGAARAGLEAARDDEEPRSVSTSGLVAGTPAYMAPEQLRGEAVTAATDQFSFCVALYEAIFGERPFRGTTVEERRRALAAEKKPEARGAKAPTWLVRVIGRGLASDPRVRFADMDDLVRALSIGAKARQRRWIVAAAALALVGMASAHEARSQLLCRGAAKRLVGTWDPAKKQQVHAALVRSGRSFAIDSANRIERRLDQYAADWLTMRDDSCRAHVRGEQSSEVEALRTECLDERLEEVKSLVGLLSRGDDQILTQGIKAAAELTSLSRCRTDWLLARRPQPPRHSEAAVRLAALRGQLAQLSVLETAGRFREGRDQVSQLMVAIRQAGYPPLEAEALFQLGVFQERLGEFKLAEQTLFTALWRAEASSHDELAARAWIRILRVAAAVAAHFDRADEWVHGAEAAVQRIGHDASVEIDLLNSIGGLRWAEGKYDQAASLHQRALALQEKAASDRSEMVDTLNALADALLRLGRIAEALDDYERARRIAESTLGPQHPDVATLLAGIGLAERARGNLERARELLERSLEINRAALGDLHPWTATAYHNLGVIDSDLKRLPEAAANLQKGLALREQLFGPFDRDVASSLASLAKNYRDAHDYDRALTAYRRAIDVVAKTLGPDHPDIAVELMGIGQVYLQLEQPRRAIDPLERALRIREAMAGDPVQLATIRFRLARALWSVGRERPRARRLAALAQAAYREGGPAATTKRVEVEQWLSATGS